LHFRPQLVLRNARIMAGKSHQTLNAF